MSAVIQVPGPSRRGAAQARIAAGKSRSKVTV
jgi:hypothetical protein